MNYEVKAEIRTITPFHTGSDTKEGNLMQIRKDNVVDYSGGKIVTLFKDEQSLNNAVLSILYPHFRAMNSDLKKGNNAYGGYSIFFSFVRKALSVSNSWINFQSNMLELTGAENISRTYRTEYKEVVKALNYEHFALVFRLNLQWLKTELVSAVQQNSEFFNEYKENNKTYEGYIEDFNYFPYEICESGYELGIKCTEVAVIYGNSIRGKLRRLVFNAFCELADIKMSDLKHQLVFELLIQGGRNLHKQKKGAIPEVKGSISDFYFSSDGVINIKNRIELFNNIPYLSLFGAAFGNQTIDGKLHTNHALLRCKENKTGELNASDFLDIIFFTHSDETKKVNHEFLEVEEKTAQMKYDMEVIRSNSYFDTSFSISLPKNDCLTDYEKIELSCFYWLLELFQKDANLGARNNKGEGKFEVKYSNISSNSSDIFIDYVRENKDKIKKYLLIS